MILKYSPYNAYLNLGQMKPYYSDHFTGELVEKYKNNPLEQMNHCFVDRTGMIPNPFKIESIPFPEIQFFNPVYSFKNIVDMKCQLLLHIHNHVNVLWSGGIDSTCLLFSLLANASDEQLKKINVILTYNSILESGSLFDKFIKGRVKYHLTPQLLRGEVIKSFPKGMFITGGLGDQIMGRNDLLQEFPNASLHQSYEDYINKDLIDFVQPALEKSPRKIKTLFDFGWFYSFNFSWQSVKYHNHISLTKEQQDRFINFYEDRHFQQWAIQNHEPAILPGRGMETYKWPMRELILKYTNDNHYVENKLKHVSQHSYTKPNWLALLQSGETIYS